ncbi:MAG: DUF4919 domain-containing protein [Muribaculaceae bacterium]|nr:DUF4919 domain-containing protein [Muribaculaceae bacterium]MBR5117555.1 DUF4919 domain-containing protein [Muribaculaceae bacterium]
MNKNRIFFSLVLLLLTALAVNAQYKFKVTELDFDKIKQETLNPYSRYYYPKLVKSFKSNDTIMNFEAYRNLYYGFIFQEDYNPFRHNEFEGKDEVEALYYKSTPLSREECDKIARYAEMALDDNLFDIDQLNYYIYALKEKKKYARAAVRQYRLDKLIAAIMSSGRGTEDEPWVVIFPEHEYTIINFLGYVAKDHQELEGGIDCIKSVSDKDPKKTRDFYFDVSQMLQETARKFPDDF